MKLFLSLGILVLLNSCVNTKKTTAVWIAGSQTYYERKNGTVANPQDSILTKKLVNGARAIVTLPVQPSDVLTIKFVEEVSGKSVTDNSKTRLADDSKDPAAPGNYVPGMVTVPGGVAANATFRSPKFKYIEYKPVIQTLTIPFKYRPRLRDTIKSTASAAFNVGFAYAFKFTVNTYRKIYWNDAGTAAALSNQFNKLTYAFGPFAGPTVIDLASSNTDQKLTSARSVLGLTYGIFGVVGYNEFNVGLAAGRDHPFGSDGKSWIYKDRTWIGIVVALDIIK